MCFKTECEKCEKPTWKGCGKHIEQALKDVPEDERCKCPRETPAATAVTTETKVEETTATADEETKTADTEESKDKAEDSKDKTD